MININLQKPAKRYADAFFQEVCDKNPNQTLEELNQFVEFYNDIEFRNFLSHPIVSNADKKDVVLESFANFNQDTLNFIQILIDENRIECITQIRDFFEEYLNTKNNLMTVEVTLAIDPKPDLAQLIQKTLEKKYNSSLKINFLKNEEILGGMLIKYGDTVIDLSVRNKIEKFSKI